MTVFIGDEAFELRENLMKPFNAIARFGVLQKPITLRLDRISDVVLACCTLHNFLRATSPNKYTPSDCLDKESEGVLIPGLRMEERRKLQRNRKRAKETNGKKTRDAFVKYFNGNGKVEWQDRYA
ncbi:hypothetical protein J6590_086397 [Homalodisca vitripennis]|nr:hypothetical protein J6590_086397 [Homalodisca vitripennis]